MLYNPIPEAILEQFDQIAEPTLQQIRSAERLYRAFSSGSRYNYTPQQQLEIMGFSSESEYEEHQLRKKFVKLCARLRIAPPTQHPTQEDYDALKTLLPRKRPAFARTRPAYPRPDGTIAP